MLPSETQALKSKSFLLRGNDQDSLDVPIVGKAACVVWRQATDIARTKAVRTIKELLFMHARVDEKAGAVDPPHDLAVGKAPSLRVSRSLFVREAEKKWKVSELVLENLLVMEEKAVRDGSMRLQSEVIN